MRPRLVAACLALAAAPALAQPAADPAEVAALEACAAEHLPHDLAAAEAACIGLTSGACTKEGEGWTTLGMIDCLSAEARAWDVLLNDDWPKLMRAARALDAANAVQGMDLPSYAEEQRAAQRKWLAWRDAECAALRAAWGTGSHGRVVAAECWLRLTARRTLGLRRRLMDMPR